MALCHITGTVQLPDGTNAAGRILVFKRNPETVVAQSGHGIVPDEIAVKVAADGTVDFKLYTGNYIGFLRNQRQGNERVFNFPVPESATALFQDILQAVDPVEPLPSWLTEAFEARDDAEGFADDAEAASLVAQSRTDIVLTTAFGVSGVTLDTLTYSMAGIAEGVTVRAGDTNLLWRAISSSASTYAYVGAGGVKFGAVGSAANYVTPAQFGAKGTGNDRAAIIRWLDALAADDTLIGWWDKDYTTSTRISHHGGGAIIRGPFSDQARFICPDIAGALNFTGPVDIDGMVFDGARAAEVDRMYLSETIGVGGKGPLFAVYGSMVVDAPRLEGVKIGRVRSQNTGRTGIMLANIVMDVELLEAVNVWGNGVSIPGCSGKIGKVKINDVGSLGPESGRSVGFAVFPEIDPNKAPAEWFIPAGVKATENIQIGLVDLKYVTDSGCYVHAYPSRQDVRNIEIGTVIGYCIGKDTMKVREYAHNIRVGQVISHKVGLRHAIIENGCTDVTYGSVLGMVSGYDVIGEMYGEDRNFSYGPNNGRGETINTAPQGVLMSGGLVNCHMLNVSISGTRQAPNGSEGHAIILNDCTNCSYPNLITTDSDGVGVRILGAINCLVRGQIVDSSRDDPTKNSCSITGDPSINTTVDLRCIETGTPQIQCPIRIYSASDNLDLNAEFNPAHFLGFSGQYIYNSGGATNLRYRKKKEFKVVQSVTTDENGVASITHGLGETPVVSVNVWSAFERVVVITGNTSSTTTFKVYSRSTGNPIASTEMSVSYHAEVGQRTAGWSF